MRAILAKDRVALVQRPVHGKDYRLVVLDTVIDLRMSAFP